MAIFARLFYMVVSLVVFSLAGVGVGAASMDSPGPQATLKMGICGAAGAFLGLVIGKYSGEWVAGPPPKN